MQIAQTAEVWIFLRQNDGREIKLRDRKAVFLKAGTDLLMQHIRKLGKVLVDFEDIKAPRLDRSSQVRLYRHRDERAETALQRFGKAEGVGVPRDTLHGANELYEELSRIVHHEIHTAARAKLQRQAGF